MQAEATITPNPKFPFRITSTEIDKQLAEKIDVQIKLRKEIYHIIVSNRNSAAGKYWGKVTFKLGYDGSDLPLALTHNSRKGLENEKV